MKTYRFNLIRHGRIVDSDDVYYYGKTDLELTQSGIKQLNQNLEKEIYPYCERLYCSPMKRCRQTADIIFPGMEMNIVDGLSECDFGDFEGKRILDLQGTPEFSKFIGGEAPPNGESGEAFIKRSVVAFAKLVEDCMRDGVRNTSVVAHGGTIMAILSVCGIPQLPFNEWICEYGHGYTLLVTPSIWMRGYKAEVIAEI